MSPFIPPLQMYYSEMKDAGYFDEYADDVY